MSALALTNERFTFPAEWEEQDCIWITWDDQSYWSGERTGSLVLNIIKSIEAFEQVKIIVSSEDEQEKVSRLLERKDNIKFEIIEKNDRWLRDMGPIFLKGSRGNFKIADFGYTFYGERPKDDPFCVMVDKIHKEVAERLKLPLLETPLVSEGGDREVNGKGTMICCEAVELQRNPGLTKQQIEEELLRAMGQRKIIWIKQGPREDDKCTNGPIENSIYTPTITGGHVDEFCRFVNPSTILLSEVSELEKESNAIFAVSHQRLKEAYKLFSETVDQDGKPFTIIRMPVPDHVIYTQTIKDVQAATYFGKTTIDQTISYIPASSYLNFVIANKVVLVPSYWKEGMPKSTKLKDQKAKEIISTFFPDRQIIQINPEAINHGGGGMHCITQQQPQGVDTRRQSGIL